jgi:hypothetical protein
VKWAVRPWAAFPRLWGAEGEEAVRGLRSPGKAVALGTDTGGWGDRRRWTGNKYKAGVLMKYNEGALTRAGIILIFACIPQWVCAQTTVKAGVFLGMPFVTENPAELPRAFVEEVDGKGIPFYGMAIDLWLVLQNRMNLQTEYCRYTNLSQMIQDLEDEKIDLILTNLTVNYERAQRIKFTFPWLEGGLRVVVNTNTQKPVSMKWELYIVFSLLFFAAMGLLSIPLTLVRKKSIRSFQSTRWKDFRLPSKI